MRTKRSILIVEDDLTSRRILSQILSPDYDTLEAANGQEALDLLNQGEHDVSLIFLDIWMPVMDGYTFMEKLRTNHILAAIPVIVLTGRSGEEDEVKALAMGATDFITKPYKPRVVLHRAASIIALRETAALMNQMEYDRLTGLYSQAFFYQRVRQVLRRNPDKKYDLICSDVENFKFVNEAFGLETGDRVLRLIAQELRELPCERIYGRLQADVFACMVEHGALDLEQALSRAVKNVRNKSGAAGLAIKWGVYEIADQELPVEQMCDRALLACKSVKGKYGRFLAMYDDELRRARLYDKMLEDGMEAALREHQFEVYFQPKFNLNTSRICGAEALVRWNHPTLGLLAPGKFIPLFERNGFITRLDQYIWEEAASILHGWRDRGLPLVPVSVNVSRADIYNADLVTILCGIRDRHGLDRSALHLEITETAYMENHTQLCATVACLRSAGFVIEMDDFGSGYSSLNMLNELPIDILKLDLKFLQEGNEHGKRRSILSFVVSLAKWLDLQVIAEGVETAEQVEKLRSVGCTMGQGYYFSRPIPKKDFERFLRDVDVSEDENAFRDDGLLDRSRLLEAAANHDYLTGLLNRRGLNDALTQGRLLDTDTAVFIFDLDNLKQCNDFRGHSQGDELLRTFGEILRSHTRRGDVLSRIGGDEFVAVMPQMRSVESALHKGEEICRAFHEKCVELSDGGSADASGSSCSAGLALIQKGEAFEDTFARADQALYRAKRGNKGVCCV